MALCALDGDLDGEDRSTALCNRVTQCSNGDQLLCAWRLSSADKEITTLALQAAVSSIQVGRPCERQQTGRSKSEINGIADQVSQCQRDLDQSVALVVGAGLRTTF